MASLFTGLGSIGDLAQNMAAEGKQKMDNTAERAAISAGFFGLAPDWLVTDIQSDLRAVGIPLPDSLSPQGISTLGFETVGFITVIGAVAALIVRLLYAFWNKYMLFATCVFIIALGVTLFYTKNMKPLSGLLIFTSEIAVYIMIFILLWIIIWLMIIQKVSLYSPSGSEHPHDNILHALFITFPFVEYFTSKSSKKINKIGPRSKEMLRIGWTALFLFAVCYITLSTLPGLETFIGSIKESFMNKKEEDVEEAFEDKQAVADSTDNSEQVTLVNIQPVSVKQAGYVGLTEKDGEFNTTNAVINHIRAGVRFFVLQIDYLEQSPGPGFDPVYTPTLLYRNNSGALISKNGASISDLAKQLSTYAFNRDFPTYSQPLILYLHFVRMPNILTEPERYMKFMASVAEALEPIRPLILDKYDSTDFTRQKGERVLLYSPLKNFEGKVLIWTNADTSIFRNTQKLSIGSVPLSQDLDYMACMRVYLEDSTDNFGVTTVASESPAYAIIVPFKRFNGMKDRRGVLNKEKHDYAMKNKSRFVIAMPDQTEDVTPKQIRNLLTSAGVNTVPMNLFGKSDVDIKDQISFWGDTVFLKMKPAVLQSSKAAVAGYTPPPNILK